MSSWKRFMEKHEVSVTLLFLIFIMVGLLVGSYYFDQASLSWYSNVFISASCGFFTGITLYCLTNMRNNRQNRINTDYQRLKDLYDEVCEIKRDARYYKNSQYTWGKEESLSIRCEKLISRTEKFNESILALPNRIFDQFGLDDENIFTDLSSDAFADLYGKIEDIDDLSEYAEVYDSMIDYCQKAIETMGNTMRRYSELYRSSNNTFI